MLFLDVVTSSADSLAARLTGFLPASGEAPAAGKWALDPALGCGYIQVVDLGPQLKLLLHQYELHQAVHLRKLPAPTGGNTLLFSFRHVFQPPPAGLGHLGAPVGTQPTVRVSSADMAFEQEVPANSTVNTILIAADVAVFASLGLPHPTNAVLQTLLASEQPYVYEVVGSPQMQTVAAAIVAADSPPALRAYYLKLKAEELLYLFLAELLKREQVAFYPLNQADAQCLYAVRDQLLADLSSAPSLLALARSADLSESKLKRLFKQIFGVPVYTYYQTARLQEAARLLRDEHLTVSEVGHRLGFQNLSHFTRLFKRQVGCKPKQFSKSQAANFPKQGS